MQASTLSRKLLIEAGQRVLVLNAPSGYLQTLEPLPDGAVASNQADGPADVVQLFSSSREELERNADNALKSVKPGGTLWMSYPKPGDGPVSDLTRDHGWSPLHAAGLIAVTETTLDAKWNMVRFAQAATIPGAIPPADLLPVGRRATFAFRLVRAVAVPLLRLTFHYDIQGRQNIPGSGTYVIIANHLGWLDAVTILMVFPAEPRVHFLADPTGMVRKRLLWALIRATGGVVPVDRAVHHDRTLFHHVFKCLELGGAIALFPEGDFGPQEGELLPFKKGFAHFAVEGNVPVVPVALSGMKDVWLGKRVCVRIGVPIATTGKTIDEILESGTAAVMKVMPFYEEPPGAKPLRRWLTGLF